MSTDLDPLLKRLHLANTRRVWRDLVRRAETEEWSFEQMLLTLFSEEVAHRRGTRLTRSVRAARFPFLRTIEEFDFSYQSTLRLTTVGSLLAPDFVTEGNSVILVGKTGRGKTHLAISMAYRAMQNGFEALFTNCAELIDDISCASRNGNLREAIARYVKPHVLVVDEVGYLTYGSDAANVLFHVVNERHIKKRSMIFTTNKHPKRWGPVLHDDDLAEVIVDRILERGRLLRLDGPSMRTKHLADDANIDDDQDETERLRFSGKSGSEFPELAPLLLESSTKVALDTDWTDPKRKAQALQKLLKQLRGLLAYVQTHLPEEAVQPPLREPLDALQQIIEQDLEPDPDDPKGKRLRIRQGVAKNRRVSITDSDMRHGRKTRSKAFNGYKQHVLVDVDRRLVLACAVVGANRPEHEAMPALPSAVPRASRSAKTPTVDVPSIIRESLRAPRDFIIPPVDPLTNDEEPHDGRAAARPRPPPPHSAGGFPQHGGDSALRQRRAARERAKPEHATAKRATPS